MGYPCRSTCRRLSAGKGRAPMNTAERPRRDFGSSRCLSLLGIGLIFGIMLAAALAVWDLRTRAIGSDRRNLSNLGAAVAAEIAHFPKRGDLVTQEVGASVLAGGAPTPEGFRHAAAAARLHRLAAERVKLLPELAVIEVIDAGGRLVGSSRTRPAQALPLADRDSYRHFRTHDDPSLFIGAAVKSRAVDAPVIHLARRIDGPRGEFLGVVTATIDIENFKKTILSGREGSLALLRTDGTLIARYPSADRPGGTAPLTSLHRVGEYPLLLRLGLSQDTTHAPWRRQAMVIAIAAICVVVGFAFLFFRLASQLRRLEHSEAALAVQNARLESQATELLRSAEALRLAKEEAVAERERTEEARRLAEETTRQHLEAQRIGRLGHWFTDEAKQVTTWSPQMSETLGLPPRPALSTEEARSFIHRDDLAAFLEARTQAVATRTTATVESRWVRPDGEIRWVRIEMSPKCDAEGHCIGMFGTTQDITERKQAEEALRAARQQLIDAIESISEGFVLFDRDDQYVLTNTQ